jgi:hypothetical protein
MRYICVIRAENGLIASYRDYWNPQDTERQMGAVGQSVRSQARPRGGSSCGPHPRPRLRHRRSWGCVSEAEELNPHVSDLRRYRPI